MLFSHKALNGKISGSQRASLKVPTRAPLRVSASYQPSGGSYDQRPSSSYQPVGTAIAGAPSYQPGEPGSHIPPPENDVFSNVEMAIQRTFNSQQPGQRNDWREIEGAFVLYPPNKRAPEAVVHFIGEAFVGAAPQIAYRLFLEALSNRNVLVVATPFGTNFDHLRIADECQFKFDRAMRVLTPDAAMLPVYGVGHGMGSVIHLLISARYSVKRSGNVLLSYNNRPATDVIPFLSPLIAPSARIMGPLLNQITASPLRSTVETVIETIRGFSPSIIRQVTPLMEQLAPMFLDVAQGRQEFSPSPDEARNLIRSYYIVPRNLLLRFKDDSMDDTNILAQTLQSSLAMTDSLDLSVRTLPGDHLRPMHQAFVDLPPEVARLANQAVYTGGDLIGRMASAADQFGVPQASEPLTEVSKGVVGMAGFFGGEVGGPVTDGMQGLADEVCAWIGSGNVVHAGTRALPAARVNDMTPNGVYNPNAAGHWRQDYNQF